MNKLHVGFHNERGPCPGCPRPPTDSEMLNWLSDRMQQISVALWSEVGLHSRHATLRQAIIAAMQAEKGKR